MLGSSDRMAAYHPIPDIAVADAVGLTPVHVNRVLKKLRVEKVMELKSGSLTILDPAKLARIAGFDDNYLHGRLKKFGQCGCRGRRQAGP